ncbi:hypothetical protein GCM10009541_35440 [Micromonospora gifhornensis]|nr:hypothetical protein [Micromonospora gifhornensis]
MDDVDSARRRLAAPQHRDHVRGADGLTSTSKQQSQDQPLLTGAQVKFLAVAPHPDGAEDLEQQGRGPVSVVNHGYTFLPWILHICQDRLIGCDLPAASSSFPFRGRSISSFLTDARASRRVHLTLQAQVVAVLVEVGNALVEVTLTHRLRL